MKAVFTMFAHVFDWLAEHPVWSSLIIVGAIFFGALLAGAAVASAVIAQSIMDGVKPEHFTTVSEWFRTSFPVMFSRATPEGVRLWATICLGLALFGAIGVGSSFRVLGAAFEGYNEKQSGVLRTLDKSEIDF